MMDQFLIRLNPHGYIAYSPWGFITIRNNMRDNSPSIKDMIQEFFILRNSIFKFEHLIISNMSESKFNHIFCKHCQQWIQIDENTPQGIISNSVLESMTFVERCQYCTLKEI